MPIKILVVDDQPEIRLLVERILEGQGYNCTQAEDAAAARRWLGEKKFDLLVCDMMMPGESGLELTTFVARAYPEMAIIILTLIKDSTTAQQAIDLGVDGYIMKPFDKHVLRIGAINALRHRQLVLEKKRHSDDLALRIDEQTRELRKKINELEDTRQDLKTAVALYEGIFDSSKAGIVIGQPTTDGRDFIYTVLNGSAEKMDNIRREDVIGRRVTEIFPNIAHMGVIEQALKTWKTGKPRHHEVSFCRDGQNTEWRDYEFFKLPSGEIVCFFTDESMRKNAETRIAEQNLYLHNLLETIPNPIFIKSTVGRFIDCNTAFSNFLGISKEAILGKTSVDIHAKNLAAIYEAADATAQKEPYTCEIETKVKYADGGLRDVIMTKTALMNSDGGLEGIVGVMQDINERKKFEKALQESEEHFRAIAESAQDAIIKMDDKGRVTHWNDSAKKIFGYGASEVIGRDLHRIIVPERYHRVTEASLNRFRQVGQRDTSGKLLQVEGMHKDGREIPIELSISSVMLNNAWHAIGIARDVTERKKLEDLLLKKHRRLKQARAELEEKNHKLKKAHSELKAVQGQRLQQEKMASIGQLAAGVAHEINNPTGFVSSNLKTLKDYMEDFHKVINAYHDLAEKLQENALVSADPSISNQIAALAALEEKVDLAYLLGDTLDLIEESREGTDRIKKIVIDLKDFAHPGQQDLVYADVHQNIESVLNIVANEIKYKATVHKNFGDLPEIQCYPQQLNQVFMNLLVNAAQAMASQGEITIRTNRNDNHVGICISDTGCGIPEAHQKKIFDPFFTTKPVGKGTGLGLNVAYNIIKKHGGTIEVESAPGMGTTFAITLPIDQSSQDATGEPFHNDNFMKLKPSGEGNVCAPLS